MAIISVYFSIFVAAALSLHAFFRILPPSAHSFLAIHLVQCRTRLIIARISAAVATTTILMLQNDVSIGFACFQHIESELFLFLFTHKQCIRANQFSRYEATSHGSKCEFPYTIYHTVGIKSDWSGEYKKDCLFSYN